MATNGWKTWKSNATGCIGVVGESDTLVKVMHPWAAFGAFSGLELER